MAQTASVTCRTASPANADQVGQTVCKGTACVAGKFFEGVAQTASVTCKNCVAGQYQNETGQTDCKGAACAVGTFFEDVAQTASVTCKICGIGQYQDVTGATECKNCASGKTTSKLGAAKFDDCDSDASESDCLQGQEPVNGSATIQFAKHSLKRLKTIHSCGGRFANETREYSYCGTTCLTCPAGQSQPKLGPGPGACKPCSAGRYQPALGQAGCIPCPPGTYGDSLQVGATGRDSHCRQCPTGQHQPGQRAWVRAELARPGGTNRGQDKNSANRAVWASRNGVARAHAWTARQRVPAVGSYRSCQNMTTCSPGFHAG